MSKQGFSKERKTQLLTVIVFLAALRFVAYPIVESQQAQREELNMVTRQLERAERLLNSDTAAEDLSEQLDRLKADLLPHAGNSNFRLTVQRNVERILRENQVDVQVFDWVSVSSEGGFARHQAQIAMQGARGAVVKSQFALLNDMPGTQLQEMTLQPQRAGARRGAGRAEIIRLSIFVQFTGVINE